MLGAPVLRSNDACWCRSGRKYKRCHKPLEGKVLPGSLSEARKVPEGIELPDYALTGEPVSEDEPMVKPPELIERMRSAGRVAALVLQETAAAIAPGVATDELDRIAHEACLRHGAYPSPLNYHGFPKSICTSVNEVICHGIPDSRDLLEGDIVNLDVTVYLEGAHGDTNATYAVGTVDPRSMELIDTTERCLEAGISAVRPGRPISDIGAAIERLAHAHGFGVVKSFVGHGIGENFHTAPHVPHYYDPHARTVMQPGMAFTIEPMITIGSVKPVVWDDGWTAVTSDAKRSAQFEHTLVVTDDGCEVLTRLPAG
ncbi:MAG: type I methionyl aminopeptidase [Acidimicrobiales bacterium]